ncbi:MAG: FtsX-like permease family protein [Ilumatobacter sp.]
MTILDEPGVIAARPQPTSSPSQRRSPVASWVVASRLARREVRRRPGRTILVMLLVALPVIAMASASAIGRTLSDANTNRFEWTSGQADLTWSSRSGPVPSLPAGSQSTDVLTAFSALASEVDGEVTTISANLIDVDLSLPVTEGIVDVVDGVAPVGGAEVLLSTGIARDLGVRLGDTVRFVRPDSQRRVVGFGELQSRLDSDLVVMPELDRDVLLPNVGDERTLIDIPDGVDPIAFSMAYSEANPDVQGFGLSGEFFVRGDELSSSSLAWGWVAGMVAYVALGIIITAAFTTSARRQLVTIGQLSASGASESMVRRTMGMQGAWTGAVGAAFGLVVAVGGAVLSDRQGWIERIVNRSTGPLRLDVADMVAIGFTAVAASTVAALIPARSASKIPVLTALAGRRPVRTPPRWLGPLGGGLVAVGLTLLGVAAANSNPDDLVAAVALVGALCVLFGMVGAAPLIVAGVGRIGAQRRGVIRLASRSLDRGRSRSAAVLTAIATVAALATAGATSVGLAERSEQQQAAQWGRDLSIVTLDFQRDYYQSPAAEAEARANDGIFDRPPERPTSLPDSLRMEIQSVLPDSVVVPVASVVIDPLPIDVRTFEESGAADLLGQQLTQVAVLTDALSERAALTDDQLKILEEDGIIETGSHGFDDAWPFVILDEDGPLNVMMRSASPASPPGSIEDLQPILASSNRWIGEAIVTEEFAEENGLEVGVSRYWVENPVDLTDAQRVALRALNVGGGVQDVFVPSATAPGVQIADSSGFETWSVDVTAPSGGVDWRLVRLAVGVASLLLVLFVVAVGLLLAAAESREERDVLHALGAPPMTLRRVAAAKAWVLSTGAALVAVPLGYAAAFVVGRATDSIGAAPFPWEISVALLVIIPAFTAGATWLASACGQRYRPASFSTFAVD